MIQMQTGNSESYLILLAHFVLLFAAICAAGFYCLERMEKTVGDVQSAVDAVVEQLVRAKEEILVEISALEAAVADGEVPDLSALKAAAQALDDVVADAPVVEPVDEVVVEG
jgi:hypothetical protein